MDTLTLVHTYFTGIATAIASYNLFNAAVNLYDQPKNIRSRALCVASVLNSISIINTIIRLVDPAIGYGVQMIFWTNNCAAISPALTISTAVHRYTSVIATPRLRRLVFQCLLAYNIASCLVELILNGMIMFQQQFQLVRIIQGLILVHPLEVAICGLCYFTWALYVTIIKQEQMFVETATRKSDQETPKSSNGGRAKTSPAPTSPSPALTITAKLGVVMKVNLALTLFTVVMFITLFVVLWVPGIDKHIGDIISALTTNLLILIEQKVADIGKAIMDAPSRRKSTMKEPVSHRPISASAAL
ncbi:hypothetical protein RI367_007159 [Sorochytrium milnesiophthora]